MEEYSIYPVLKALLDGIEHKSNNNKRYNNEHLAILCTKKVIYQRANPIDRDQINSRK